jgi:hypothetical protein
MWPLVVVFTVLSAVGAMVVSQAASAPPVEQARSEEVARSVALYRALVLEAARSRPDFVGTMPDDALHIPPWYLRDSAWTNAVLPDGTVIVYSTRRAQPGLLADLVQVSDRSMLIGEVRAGPGGAATLYSPHFGDTGLAVPNVPVGSVAWLSNLN